jgi:hypothetical protein
MLEVKSARPPVSAPLDCLAFAPVKTWLVNMNGGLELAGYAALKDTLCMAKKVAAPESSSPRAAVAATFFFVEVTSARLFSSRNCSRHALQLPTENELLTAGTRRRHDEIHVGRSWARKKAPRFTGWTTG